MTICIIIVFMIVIITINHLVVLLHQPRTLHLLWPPQHEHHVTRPGNYSLQLLLAHVMQNCSTEAGA